MRYERDLGGGRVLVVETDDGPEPYEIMDTFRVLPPRRQTFYLNGEQVAQAEGERLLRGAAGDEKNVG